PLLAFSGVTTMTTKAQLIEQNQLLQEQNDYQAELLDQVQDIAEDDDLEGDDKADAIADLLAEDEELEEAEA
ncbi:MAG: hypothetical protein WCO47_11925, partial [Methylococcus sp.]